MRLDELIDYLDGYLATSEIEDHPGAWNGLQVENRSGSVERVAFAVDAVQATIDEAARRGASLLIAHHGLFWEGIQPLTGGRYRRIRSLLAADLAVYASHLPLDLHPEVGNNVVLARQLDVSVEGWFGEYKGRPLGVWGKVELRREALAARLDETLGCRVRMIAGGPERVQTVGIITGSGAGQLEAARRIGLDALITGEAVHHHYFVAAEGGINLYIGGHYATEVWGVRSLAAHLEGRFGLDCSFIDHPTGL